MTNRINFVKDKSDMLYNPDKQYDTFYQICRFKNKYSGKHETRKIVFDEMNNVKKIYVKEYSTNIIKKFIKTCPTNKFKLYPVYDINTVNRPCIDDMIESRSDLLNGNNDTDYVAVNF